MTQITFGKYSGWNTDTLARFTDGRSYLAWGTVNLKSPQWQKEFQLALDSTTEIDLNLEAESIMRSDAQMDYNDAYILAQDTIAQLIEDEQRQRAYEVARTRFFSALRSAGISENGIASVFTIIERHGIEELAEVEKVGRIKFTDATKRNAIWQAAIEFDGDLDNI